MFKNILNRYMSDKIKENSTEKDLEKTSDNKPQDKKEIEIVSDDGSTLDISHVSDAIIGKSKNDKPKNIVIPKGKK